MRAKEILSRITGVQTPSHENFLERKWKESTESLHSFIHDGITDISCQSENTGRCDKGKISSWYSTEISLKLSEIKEETDALN